MKHIEIEIKGLNVTEPVVSQATHNMKNKRYLFNCRKDPRQATQLVRNRIARNPGDLVYEYSVMNALATDASVEFVPTGDYHSLPWIFRC